VPEVRAATQSDLPRLSLALTTAFADDPVFEYLVGTGRTDDVADVAAAPMTAR
jgi:hypothetical protein